MRRRLWPLLSMVILLLAPNWVFADCMDLGLSNRWVAEDENKIVFYRGEKPLGIIILQSCKISTASKVRLIKSYVCDSDKIAIDNEECSLLNVNSSSF